jgi:hypothetical protein
MTPKNPADRVDPEWIKAQREQGWPDMHPEDYCHRCGARNDISWCASAEDWQTATAAWAAETGREGICCIPCFVEMHREATGRDETWVPTLWRGSWDLHAAHPAPVSDTRREDVARALHIADADGQNEAFLLDVWNRSTPTHGVRQYWYRLADAVLAVLPAPPVVDEAEVRAEAATKAEKRHPSWHDNGVGVVQGSHWRAGYVEGYTAARLRGATRG